MRHNYSTTLIGGSYIQHSLNLPDSDILLIFDYLFHKQCFRLWEQGFNWCSKEDFTIFPLCPEKHDSLWQFEALSKEAQVLIEKTFSPHETLRIARRALTVVTALNMKSEQRSALSDGLFSI